MARPDVDSAVQAEIQGLISRMRARRLQGELPPPADALPVADEQPVDDSGDQQALESMLEPE